MARTVQQILEVARGLIQDESSPFRYSDASLCLSLSEAVAEARRLRPDLFVDTLLDTLPLYTTADILDTIPLPDTYMPALANYVAGRTQLRDDEFSMDGRAVMLITAFVATLTGGKRE
jgi:hypothetical protein